MNCKNRDKTIGESTKKRVRKETLELREEDIISIPALCKPINDYEPRLRDKVRRKYVLQGPCQPLSHGFPRTHFGNKMRCFQVNWFKNWEWL